MSTYLIWLLVAIGLVIAELVTGTFYLLFLGIAALVGAAVAYLGMSFLAQALIAALVAVMGVIWVQRHNRMRETRGMVPLDVGQPVTWEAWINPHERLARVKYRGATWDAHVDSEIGGEVGEVLYIVGLEGSTLRVAKRKSA